jgi:hypothetical protein
MLVWVNQCIFFNGDKCEEMVNMAAIAVIDAQEKTEEKKISTVLNKTPYSIGVLL